MPLLTVALPHCPLGAAEMIPYPPLVRSFPAGPTRRMFPLPPGPGSFLIHLPHLFHLRPRSILHSLGQSSSVRVSEFGCPSTSSRWWEMSSQVFEAKAFMGTISRQVEMGPASTRPLPFLRLTMSYGSAAAAEEEDAPLR